MAVSSTSTTCFGLVLFLLLDLSKNATTVYESTVSAKTSSLESYIVPLFAFKVLLTVFLFLANLDRLIPSILGDKFKYTNLAIIIANKKSPNKITNLLTCIYFELFVSFDILLSIINYSNVTIIISQSASICNLVYIF